MGQNAKRKKGVDTGAPKKKSRGSKMGAVEYLKERIAVLKQQELELRKKEQENLMEMEKQGTNILGRIQGLTKGGSDKRPPKAVARRGVRGHVPPENF